MKIYSWSGFPSSDNAPNIGNGACVRPTYFYLTGSYNTIMDSSSVTPSLNVLYARPFSRAVMSANSLTAKTNSESVSSIIRNIQVNWTTVAGAGGVARIGMYTNTSDKNLYPSTLVYDSGELATTAGTGIAPLASLTIATNTLYWYVVLFGTAAPLLRGATTPFMLGGGANINLTPLSACITVNQTYGALPATFPSGGLPETSSPFPRILVSF